MKAYAILAGGGVKGAALAGCLQAAHDLDIEFMGYGGTSAGSIVALLAAVGYDASHIRKIMVEEINFHDFLDDQGRNLDAAKKGWHTVSSCLHTPAKTIGNLNSLLPALSVAKIIMSRFGLYHGDNLKKFLRQKVIDKLPHLASQPIIRFHDLAVAGCKGLKIVASDIRLSQPVVFSNAGGSEVDEDVVDAVRASISFPLVFQPVRINSRVLVDGGLCSNLPVFLFEEERRKSDLPIPVVAFDLVTTAAPPASDYKFSSFSKDILSTAVESGDKLLRKALQGIYYVPVDIPASIDTLDFKLSRDQRDDLFHRGNSVTNSYFRDRVPQWMKARNSIERLQALRGDPKLIGFLLGVAARMFEQDTHATNIRANIMLPVSDERRIVVYQYGMDTDPDCDLELSMNGGCTGLAWETRGPAYADFVAAKSNFSSDWKMTQAEQNKVRNDRKAMMSVPIFAITSLTSGEKKKVDDFPLLGTFSLDTDVRLQDTGWISNESPNQEVLTKAKCWADTFGKLLTERGIDQ